MLPLSLECVRATYIHITHTCSYLPIMCIYIYASMCIVNVLGFDCLDYRIWLRRMCLAVCAVQMYTNIHIQWMNEWMDKRIRFSFPFSSALLLYVLSTIVLIYPLLIECIEYTIKKKHYAHIICMQRVSWLLIENVLVVECRQEYHFNLMCVTFGVCGVLYCISNCVRMLMKYS